MIGTLILLGGIGPLTLANRTRRNDSHAARSLEVAAKVASRSLVARRERLDIGRQDRIGTL